MKMYTKDDPDCHDSPYHATAKGQLNARNEDDSSLWRYHNIVARGNQTLICRLTRLLTVNYYQLMLIKSIFSNYLLINSIHTACLFEKVFLKKDYTVTTCYFAKVQS